MGADAAVGGQERNAGRPKRRFRMHWHVMLTHFPISTFLGALIFAGLSLLTSSSCYTRAAYVSLLLGAVVMLPITATGWFTWKHRYRGTKNTLFLAKIWISVAMVAISASLAIYQTAHPFRLLDVRTVSHMLWLVGVLLLVLGAVAEGYFGGQLHHR